MAQGRNSSGMKSHSNKSLKAAWKRALALADHSELRWIPAILGVILASVLHVEDNWLNLIIALASAALLCLLAATVVYWIKEAPEQSKRLSSVQQPAVKPKRPWKLPKGLPPLRCEKAGEAYFGAAYASVLDSRLLSAEFDGPVHHPGWIYLTDAPDNWVQFYFGIDCWGCVIQLVSTETDEVLGALIVPYLWWTNTEDGLEIYRQLDSCDVGDEVAADLVLRGVQRLALPKNDEWLVTGDDAPRRTLLVRDQLAISSVDEIEVGNLEPDVVVDINGVLTIWPFQTPFQRSVWAGNTDACENHCILLAGPVLTDALASLPTKANKSTAESATRSPAIEN